MAFKRRIKFLLFLSCWTHLVPYLYPNDWLLKSFSLNNSVLICLLEKVLTKVSSSLLHWEQHWISSHSCCKSRIWVQTVKLHHDSHCGGASNSHFSFALREKKRSFSSTTALVLFVFFFFAHLALLLGLKHVLSGRSRAGAAHCRISSLFPHPVQHEEPQHQKESWLKDKKKKKIRFKVQVQFKPFNSIIIKRHNWVDCLWPHILNNVVHRWLIGASNQNNTSQLQIKQTKKKKTSGSCSDQVQRLVVTCMSDCCKSNQPVYRETRGTNEEKIP